MLSFCFKLTKEYVREHQHIRKVFEFANTNQNLIETLTGGHIRMQKEIVMVIAENIDAIVNIYKMSRNKDTKLIEENIKKAIMNIRDNGK
jgi:hypothetical protein